MPKANKDYECFECGSIIQKGQEYTRQARYESPIDVGRQHNAVQKPICSACISDNKYSFIDNKYNSPDIIKFGMYSGINWDKAPDDYIIYIYKNSKNNRYWNEIEKEYNRRLKHIEVNEIKPISDNEALEHIKKLKENLLNPCKLKNTPQITDTMRIVYKTLLTNKDKIKRHKYEYNSYYWLFEKSTDVKIKRYCNEIDNRTVTALYERGLLKPTLFKDDVQKRTTEVIEYEAIYDNRVLLNRWGN